MCPFFSSHQLSFSQPNQLFQINRSLNLSDFKLVKKTIKSCQSYLHFAPICSKQFDSNSFLICWSLQATFFHNYFDCTAFLRLLMFRLNAHFPALLILTYITTGQQNIGVFQHWKWNCFIKQLTNEMKLIYMVHSIYKVLWLEWLLAEDWVRSPSKRVFSFVPRKILEPANNLKLFS